MAYSLIDPALMLSISRWLLGAWGLLNALQWLVSAGQWRSGTALGWDLQGLRQSRIHGGSLLARIFSRQPMRIVLVAQLLASSAFCFLFTSWASVAALLVLIVTSTLLTLRSTGDGADKMAMVVAYGLLLQILGDLGELPVLNLAGFLWVGGQLTLAYATSGIAKLVLRDWRNGEVLRKTFSSYIFGHRFAHAAVALPGAAVALAWSVILAESLFPLALFSTLPVLAVLLGIMGLLHLATAVFMGLNTYPLAFLAAYPSLLLLAQWLNAVTI